VGGFAIEELFFGTADKVSIGGGMLIRRVETMGGDFSGQGSDLGFLKLRQEIGTELHSLLYKHVGGHFAFGTVEMLEFMDYVQHAFYIASNWNVENSYSQLTATARGDWYSTTVYAQSNICSTSRIRHSSRLWLKRLLFILAKFRDLVCDR
jgi:hypothetical protein